MSAGFNRRCLMHENVHWQAMDIGLVWSREAGRFEELFLFLSFPDALLFSWRLSSLLPSFQSKTQVPWSRRHHGLPPLWAHAHAGQVSRFVPCVLYSCSHDPAWVDVEEDEKPFMSWRRNIHFFSSATII